ncbi:MAG: hypothetical protein OXE55_05995 [Flavobacteriaceae bacterium]|nr:hypothetical protein [Flavobacteriaceae bacterium]MCY4254319.1 hypothetical protein [Flavobacteriaceae bacterium]
MKVNIQEIFPEYQQESYTKPIHQSSSSRIFTISKSNPINTPKEGNYINVFQPSKNKRFLRTLITTV